MILHWSSYRSNFGSRTDIQLSWSLRDGELVLFRSVPISFSPPILGHFDSLSPALRTRGQRPTSVRQKFPSARPGHASRVASAAAACPPQLAEIRHSSRGCFRSEHILKYADAITELARHPALFGSEGSSSGMEDAFGVDSILYKDEIEHDAARSVGAPILAKGFLDLLCGSAEKS